MSEIEEKFFKTFGIEPKELEYPDNFEYYPEITDRKLLELYVIYSQLPDVEVQKFFLDVDNMKRYILNVLIDNKDTSGGFYKRRVQSLFTERKKKATSERNFGMSKYIIKNCPAIYKFLNYYCNQDDKKLCQDCTDCVMKRIVENLRQVAYACHCDNCDGCGYYSGCDDSECGTYQALKSLELLDIQEVE